MTITNRAGSAATTSGQHPGLLAVQRRQLDPAAYQLRGAEESDFATLITGPTLVWDDDEHAVTIVCL